MENIKLNVKALAALLGVSIRELAVKADIDPDHLAKVSAGQARMTARDLINLATATEISPFNIQY